MDSERSSRTTRQPHGARVLAALIFLAASILCFFWTRSEISSREKNLVQTAAAQAAALVGEQLDELMLAAQDLVMVLERQQEVPAAVLAEVALRLLQSHPVMETITIAPGGIVRYGFPEKLTASVIGKDLLDAPERAAALTLAMQERKPVLQGPQVGLDDGEIRAFLRFPIYRGENFWGFLNIAIDARKLYQACRFESRFPGMDLALYAENMQDRFAGSLGMLGTMPPASAVVQKVSARLAGDQWVIAAALVPNDADLMLGAFVWLALSLSGAVLMVLLPGMGLPKRASGKNHAAEQQQTARHRKAGAAESHAAPNLEPASEPVGQRRNPAGAAPASDAHATHAHASHQKPEETVMAFPAGDSRDGDSTVQAAPLEQEYGVDTPKPSAVQESPGSALEKEKADASSSETVTGTEQPATADASDQPQSAPSPARVLIVDDAERNRAILLTMLQRKGYTGVACSSAEEALELLADAAEKFDIIVVDRDLHGRMSGLDFATHYLAKIKPGEQRAILLAMSMHHEEAEVRRCRYAGFDDLIVKPFTMTAFDRKLRVLLQIRS
ncbi:MAG: response regulator [Rectinemataceae bacterium]|nr:response regulator [Spirochaetaceae bacterium]